MKLLEVSFCTCFYTSVLWPPNRHSTLLEFHPVGVPPCWSSTLLVYHSCGCGAVRHQPVNGECYTVQIVEFNGMVPSCDKSCSHCRLVSTWIQRWSSTASLLQQQPFILLSPSSNIKSLLNCCHNKYHFTDDLTNVTYLNSATWLVHTVQHVQIWQHNTSFQTPSQFSLGGVFGHKTSNAQFLAK